MNVNFYSKDLKTGDLIPTSQSFVFGLFKRFPKQFVDKKYTELMTGAEVSIANMTFLAKADMGGRIL